MHRHTTPSPRRSRPSQGRGHAQAAPLVRPAQYVGDSCRRPLVQVWTLSSSPILVWLLNFLLSAARAVECTELSASPSSRESLRRLQWCTCVSASVRASPVPSVKERKKTYNSREGWEDGVPSVKKKRKHTTRGRDGRTARARLKFFFLFASCPGTRYWLACLRGPASCLALV